MQKKKFYTNHWENRVSSVFHGILKITKNDAKVDRVVIDWRQVVYKFHLFKTAEIFTLLLQNISY